MTRMARMALRSISIRLAITGAAVLLAAPVYASVFTPISQGRSVGVENQHLRVGYTCLGGGGGPPLPACPVTLIDTTTSDIHTAPGFIPDPFAATATVTSGTASHTSSVQPTRVSVSGDAAVSGSASEISDPGYLLLLDAHDLSSSDASTISVSLDEATPFTFEASGRIDYPDPSFPLSWDAEVQIDLDGPGGSVASFTVAHGNLCPDGDPGNFTCFTEPTPLVVTGTLPAGEYTLTVLSTAEASGNWLPSTGPLGAASSAEYATSLTLAAAPPVPLLGPGPLTALSALLAGAGAAQFGVQKFRRGPPLEGSSWNTSFRR